MLFPSLLRLASQRSVAGTPGNGEHAVLRQLASGVHPSAASRRRMWMSVFQRLQPLPLTQLRKSLSPSPSLLQRIKERVLARMGLDVADQFHTLSQGIFLPADLRLQLQGIVVGRLQPVRVALVSRSVKWAAALTVFLLILRSIPLVLLTPSLQAQTSVQIIPQGVVEVTVGGLSLPLSSPMVLQGPVTVRTGTHAATISFHDDGVLRLAPHTTLRIHDLSDLPQGGLGPTATLVGGKVWLLGFLPLLSPSMLIATEAGTVRLNAGSLALTSDAGRVTVYLYDRGVSFLAGEQEIFLVSGEKLTASVSAVGIPSTMTKADLSQPWVQRNLAEDAASRREVLALQQSYHQQKAGILPTSLLYPAKRLAEKIDVAFTFGSSARAQKLLDQADTRLSEALTLLKGGEVAAASGSLIEYRSSLLALASGSGDNLVKSLIKQQVATATSAVSTVTPGSQLYALKETLLTLGAALPDAEVSLPNAEGYVLVDKLLALYQLLSVNQDALSAARAYGEIQPYLQGLLTEERGVHPLLQREARSLLVALSSLLKRVLPAEEAFIDPALTAMFDDIEQYLPPEPQKTLISEEARQLRIAAMLDRIFLFRIHQSRLNQVIQEMRSFQGDPDRGPLLRRLLHALPENSKLRDYVAYEIRRLGDELSSAE